MSGPESIVAFSMCVFVDEAFVTDYLRAPSPYPAALVYEHILAGRSPVLATKDLPASNSSGNMNMLILHFRIRHPTPSDDRGRAVLAVFQSSFRPLGELRPYLMSVYRDDPHIRFLGTELSYLFQYVEPRFHFSAAEQRVLLRALMDESDEAISDALAISHDAVKKTWRRIHDRVVDVVATAPELFDDVVDVDTTRGKERRRRLLQYIRYHLEELRPVARLGRSRSR